MINRISILFLLTLSLTSSVLAQTYSLEVWHYGEILKKDSTIERGKLKYSFNEDEVQLKSPNQIKVFHAKDIVMFRLTDSISKKLRTFNTIKYTTSKNYKIPAFFEVLVPDQKQHIMLLKREYVLEYAVTDGLSGFVSYQKELETDYFYCSSEEIYFLVLKPKKFFQVFGVKELQMKEYYKNNKLRLSREADLVKIFQYYNQKR